MTKVLSLLHIYLGAGSQRRMLREGTRWIKCLLFLSLFVNIPSTLSEAFTTFYDVNKLVGLIQTPFGSCSPN